MKKTTALIMMVLFLALIVYACAQKEEEKEMAMAADPAAELAKSVANGMKLFNDKELGTSGLTCNSCHMEGGTKEGKMGETVVPVIISVYTDRSFSFITKTPPAGELLKKAAGIIKGSGVPNKDKVATIKAAQIRTIAEQKMTDLNATDIEGAMRIIAGTARSMGVTVEGL